MAKRGRPYRYGPADPIVQVQLGLPATIAQALQRAAYAAGRPLSMHLALLLREQSPEWPWPKEGDRSPGPG